MSHKSISKMIQVQWQSRIWYSAQNASFKFPLHGALKCDPLGSKSFALHTMCALTHTKRNATDIHVSVYQYPPLRVIIRIITQISYTQNFGHPTPSQAPKQHMNPNHGLFLQSLRLPTAKSAASGLEKWKVNRNISKVNRNISYIQRSEGHGNSTKICI